MNVLVLYLVPSPPYVVIDLVFCQLQTLPSMGTARFFRFQETQRM